MAFILLDSFDDRYFANGASYASYHAKWDDISEDSTNTYANSISQVTGRTGKACKIGGTSYLKKNFAAFTQTCLCGFALKIESAPGSDIEIVNVAFNHSGGNSNMSLKLTTDLDIAFYDGANLIGTTNTNDSLATNTFYYLEFILGINQSSKSKLSIQKDGVNWLTENASELENTSFNYVEAEIDSIQLKGGIIIDDLYLKTNEIVYYGQPKIDAIVPNANTLLSRSNPWTASYLDVDECFQTNHDGTTSYDISNTASPSSVSYNFTDKSYTTIKAIQSNSWVAAFEASGQQADITFSALTNISSTDYEYATTLVLSPESPAAFKYLLGAWEVNPATSSAWTSTAYNSAEFGVKSSGHLSGFSSGYLTAITLEIAYIGEETPPPAQARSRVFLIT